MQEPSIYNLVMTANGRGAKGIEGYTFLKPSPEFGRIRNALESERRTRALTGPARIVTLQRHMAIFCHRNPERKKRVYVIAGKFRLWIEIEDKMHAIDLSEATAYEIPENTWHGIECTVADAKAPGQFLVETDKDVNDAEWEQAANIHS